MKSVAELRGYFPSGKEDDAGGLTPAKEDNGVGRKIDREDAMFFVGG